MPVDKIKTTIPEKEIRAFYNDDFIRVYQAYSDEIANRAIENNSFISPHFKVTRMTWIKPSFLWMMYRAEWGYKDNKQKRILAIDITHEGFIWALSNSCLSSFKPNVCQSKTEWEKQKNRFPVRIQWDPERDIFLNKMNDKTIQIGLSGEAVRHYIREWIIHITDVTHLAHQMKSKVDLNAFEPAKALMPVEKPYSLPLTLIQQLGIGKLVSNTLENRF